MSIALSSADQEVIERTIDIPEGPDRTPLDLLSTIYALDQCVEWIAGNAFKRIALQFPDALLGDSVSVCQTIARQSGQKIFILGDTTYGSCCVDEIAAEHAACDAIIHFGPSCLSPTSRLPVALVLPSPCDFDASAFSAALQQLVLQLHGGKIVILYDTSYYSVLGSVAKGLPSNVSISRLIIPANQTVICSDRDCLSFSGQASTFGDINSKIPLHLVSHRLFPLSNGEKLVDITFVYIGASCPCMVNLFLQLPSSPFYSFDPKTKSLSLESSQINKRIMRRFYLTERAKDARIVGILIGTLGVKDYLEVIERLKKIIKSAGKRFYTFSMGKPNPAKLANFMEVDVFVYVACPESFFDSKEYLKPVVTPHEMEIACGQRGIDEGFVPDFRNLLPGGNAYVEVQKIDHDTADVSLVTGAARVVQLEESPVFESSNGEVVLHERILTVSTQLSAGDFLASRFWRGLEPHYGQNTAGDIVEGQHGIALSYEREMAMDGIKSCTHNRDGCCGQSSCGSNAADVSASCCSANVFPR